MPRETPAPSGQPEAERPFAERRDALFEQVAKQANDWQSDRRISVVGRVFEHSIEDGLRLAERLAFTPFQYQEAIDLVSFALKHPKVFTELRKKISNKSAEDNRDPFLRDAYIRTQHIHELFREKEPTGEHLEVDGLERVRDEQKTTKSQPFAAIDDLYLDTLTKRQPNLRARESTDPRNRSKGERLADRYLQATEGVLEKRYYTGPVKDMFPSLERDPLFHQPTILETDLRRILKTFRIQADAALTRLEPARVVAYSRLDAVKRSLAEQELVKELKAELPEGKTVALDREGNVYKIEGGEKTDTAQEKPGIKTEAERMAEFEERVLDEMEELLKRGANRDVVAQSLAGLDSERAWKLRERLAASCHLSSIIRGLAGLDSERAWQMRKTADRAVTTDDLLLSCTGVDSPEAWGMRNHFFQREWGHAALVESLAGLDSTRAWRMREQLQPKVDAAVMVLGLTGLDSERAWEMREALWDKAVAIDETLTIGFALTGLDSARAWDLRNRLKGGPSLRERNVLMASLTGLDSERAWKLRRHSIDERWGIPAPSLAGLDSARAWQMRRELITKSNPLYLARGLVGDSKSFLWRLNPKIRAKIGMEGKGDEKKRELTTKERLEAHDEKILDIMEQLEQEGVAYEHLCAGLVGIDSKRAWEMRERAVTKGEEISIVVDGLAGIDSPRAWKLRKRLLQNVQNQLDSGSIGTLAKSLAGLDTADAWEMRHILLEKGTPLVTILKSLVGLDSKDAWDLRNKALKTGASISDVLASLMGVDSPKAWEIRERSFSKKRKLLDHAAFDEMKILALSLSGLDSTEARDMRERWLETYMHDEDMDADLYFIPSLAGIDSEKAWLWREDYAKKHGLTSTLIESLAGLDSEHAWEMRNKVQDKEAGYLVGTYQTFVWRLRKEPFCKSEEAAGPWRKKLDLLNLVHDPTLEGIHEYLTAHPRMPPRAGLSQHEADVLGELFSDRGAAAALLATNAAVPDRAPERLADELFRRMVPSSAAEQRSLGNRLSSAVDFFRKNPPPPLSSAFSDRPSVELMGAGSEDLKDMRPVLEAREAIDTLLVRGIYGRYDAGKRTWERAYFPVRRENRGPTRETTMTLLAVAGAGRVSLPLPLDARLIPERVKGLTSDGKEVPLKVAQDSLGHATVELPSNVGKVLYSIEQPLVPEPLHDPSEKEFEAYVRTFQREHGKDLNTQLARLPHDVEAEVKSPAFQALPPKQKLIRIETLVRNLSWYDTNNEEVSTLKVGKPPEEQIAITEERIHALRAQQKQGGPSSKKRFAGVCADFALITATLLRKAGLPAGIMRGLHLTGTTARMRDSHATAFVPWPDGRGGIRLVAVDGTPSSTEEIAANVAIPSLATLEEQAAGATEKTLEESRKVIDALLTSAKAHDVDSIRQLKNSKLEHALNVILHHEVKRTHLQVIGRVLDAYWYGGWNGIDRLAEKKALREFLETEVQRARSETPETHATKPAGTQLLETVRSFIKKFQRGGAAGSVAEACDTLERVAALAKNELSDVEHRALVAVITYLRAEKMR